MKTKPITLILTLLFCLSGSVFAEEENKINRRKALADLTSIQERHQINWDRLHEISLLIGKNKKINDNTSLNGILGIVTEMDGQLDHVWDIMFYDKMIEDLKIENKIFRKYHNQVKEKRLKSFSIVLNTNLKFVKQYQILIKNTTAVIAVNDYIKLIGVIIIWCDKNKDIKIK